MRIAELFGRGRPVFSFEFFPPKTDDAARGITVFKLGTSSIGLRYAFLVDEVECVRARMTVVCTQLDGLKPTPIPPRYREKFEELLEEG